MFSVLVFGAMLFTAVVASKFVDLYPLLACPQADFVFENDAMSTT